MTHLRTIHPSVRLWQVWSLSFGLIAVVFGASQAVQGAWGAMKDIVLVGRFSDAEIGRLAATANSFGLAGGIMIPAALDVLGLQRHLKWSALCAL